MRVVDDTRSANDMYAVLNQKLFRNNEVLAVNLTGLAGSGKTSLLEGTIKSLVPHHKVGAVQVDPYSSRDAQRIKLAGAPVYQVNTGESQCIDSEMIHKALDQLPLCDIDILFIENTGSFVCASPSDLGEDLRVTVLSVSEDAHKLTKWPGVLRNSDAVLITKLDLVPHTDARLMGMHASLSETCPMSPIFHISLHNPISLTRWASWLSSQLRRKARRYGETPMNVIELGRRRDEVSCPRSRSQ